MTDTSMDGRVCIVTGAASGMGRIAARELAKKGATIVMNDREVGEGQELRCVTLLKKPMLHGKYVR